MKKLVVALAFCVAFSSQALAWKKPPYVPHGGSTSSTPKGGGGGGAACTGGCVGVAAFEGFVLGLIVVDEANRFAVAPGCATGRRTRRSYFGLVVDEPKFWRKACQVRRDPKPVSVRW